MNEKVLQCCYQLVQDVLSLEECDLNLIPTSTYLELGGDSLQAMKLCALLHDQLGVFISIGDLLNHQCLMDVFGRAKQVDRKVKADLQDKKLETLSTTQQRLWLAQEVLGGSANNLVFLAHMDGDLHINIFIQAITETVQRHDGLRTFFQYKEGDLQPVVIETYDYPLELIEYHEEVADFDRRVQLLAKELGRRVFLINEQPPISFTIVTNHQKKHTLIFTTSHLLLDGWAIGLVLKEIYARYEAIYSGKWIEWDEPTPLGAFAAWQKRLRQTGEMDAQLGFWKEFLQDVSPTLEFPVDQPRPNIQDPTGDRISYRFTDDLTLSVQKIAQQVGITPFTLLFSSFSLLIARYTGNRKFIIGIPSAGRPTPELQKLVGLCTNLVPVLVDVDEDQSVAEWLRYMQQSISLSLRHADVPFDKIVSELGISGDIRRNPLVQYTFAMHDQIIQRNYDIDGLQVRVQDGYGGGSAFDMTFFVESSDPVYSGEIEYGTSIFTRREIEHFLESYFTLIHELSSNLDRKVEEVRGVSASSKKVLQLLNQTKSEYRNNSIENLFLEQVQLTPNQIAIDCPYENQQLTYQQLEQASAIQAQKLVNAGVKPGDYVIIAVERSIAEMVAVLGVLRAGAVYIAVDADWPDLRLQQVVHVSNPKGIIASEKFKKRLADILDTDKYPMIPVWERSWKNWPTQKVKEMVGDPDRLAYIAFTSGSTGIPKGVAVRHRGVIRLVDGVDYIHLSPGERMLRFAPLAFDASTLEIWGPLINGGTCVIHPPALPSPKELGQFILETRVTHLWLTSGLFRLIAEFAPESFHGVKQLLTGGDVVPAEHVRMVMKFQPDLLVTNGYGPTENTTFTTTYTMANVDQVEETIPIGFPISNTRLYVLDDRFRLIPTGGIGELYIAGDGLATGYLHNPVETARSFGEFSPDLDEHLYRSGDLVRIDGQGRIQFLGRRDHQVKIRGKRIELDEVRKACMAFPYVADAIVVSMGNTSTDRRLLAGIVPKGDHEDLIHQIRNHLKRQIPSYMIPSLWAVVDQIPVTPNGKVDSKALEQEAKRKILNTGVNRNLSQDRPMFSVAKMAFEKVLQQTDLDEQSNFFDCGGDSLRMARLVGIIRKERGVEISLKEFYALPTLGQLEQLLIQASKVKVSL